jgi:biotin carboxyl carrier protein
MMTQSEWLASADHRPMVRLARAMVRVARATTKSATERQLALFACACCRAVWPWLAGEARHTVEQLECAADGNGAEPELLVCTSPTVGRVFLAPQPGAHAFVTIGSVVEPGSVVCSIEVMQVFTQIQAEVSGVIFEACVANRELVRWSAPLFRLVPTNGTPRSDDLPIRQANLARDVFPYPFNRVAGATELRSALAPALTPDVLTLARSVYAQNRRDTGELDRLGLSALADALEESGCADADVLSHLRSPGPHVRGCWALDLVLGKS